MAGGIPRTSREIPQLANCATSRIQMSVEDFLEVLINYLVLLRSYRFVVRDDDAPLFFPVNPMRVGSPRRVIDPGQRGGQGCASNNSVVKITHKSCKFHDCCCRALWSNKNSWDEPSCIFVPP